MRLVIGPCVAVIFGLGGSFAVARAQSPTPPPRVPDLARPPSAAPVKPGRIVAPNAPPPALGGPMAGAPTTVPLGQAPTLPPSAPPPPAAPVATKPADKVLRPTLDRTKGHVGDIINYTVQVTHEAAERWLVPGEPDFKPFELRGRDFYKRTLDDGKIEETFVFRIAVYKVGTYRTPALDIPFVNREGRTLRAVTQELDVTIESLLPAGAALPPLKDVKAPMSVVVRDWRLLWLGGILGALALLSLFGWLAYRYGKRIAARERPAPPPPPPRPAHVIAYEKLARVGLPTTDGELRHFYESVCDVMREYYGNRYGFLALDMTTAEILKILRPIAAAGAAPGLVMPEVQTFLSDADLVKFAKFVPGSDEPQQYLREARRLIDATRAMDEVPSAPSGPAAVAAASAASAKPPKKARKKARKAA